MYAREKERQGQDWALRYAKPNELGWMSLDSGTANGRAARIQVDETIATVFLPAPLLPGDSVRLSLRFAVQVPKQFDRLGHTGNGYSISQWYPKMVVYDDQGWHPDPFHYMAEFYGDYGTFDVTLRVPDNLWVGATGVLVHASGGDNEVPLQSRDVPEDSVTITVRPYLADTLSGKWPAKQLRIETDLFDGESEPIRAVVARGGAATLRVPRVAPVHYRYVWDEGKTTRDEADNAGRGRPLRLLLAVRDMARVDTLRSLAPLASDADTLLPSMKTLRFHAERVHDFAWVASPDYVVSDTTWSGIAIRSLSFRDDEEDWADAKQYAVDAMRHHVEVVGPYLYPQFTTAEAWCGGGAMEYPMLIMNEPILAGGLFHYLDDVMAHELGHNWFYGMLGSDERAHPWLDEGFTQWLEDSYVDRKYPKGLFRWADRFPWLTPKGGASSDELAYLSRAWARDERSMSTPTEQFASYLDYDVASYSKAAMMLHALRGEIGARAFSDFVRLYYRENLFQHPRPADVIHAAERASGRRLGEFFRQWTETTDRAGFALQGTRSRREGGVWRSTVTVRRTEAMTLPIAVEARFEDGSRQETRVSLKERTTVARFESRSRLRSATLDPRHEVAETDRLDNRTGPAPMVFRPLFDFPRTDALTILYGPTIWHGRDEGMRLGAWMDGRYLPMRDFPRGIRGFEAGWNAGTRTGATAWRAATWVRVGALGARGELRALAARDAGLRRAEVTVGNRTTAPGRLYPWQQWSLGVQWRERTQMTPVDSRYWSPGETVNVSGRYRIDTVGPRRSDRLELDAGLGAAVEPDGGLAPPYPWARLVAKRDLELSKQLQLGVRGVAGSAWRRAPRELMLDVAEASRLDGLAHFYENDRGPLRATGHYLAEGGGGLRGFAGRAGLGQRLLAANVDVTHGLGVFAFGDVGRVEASGVGEADSPAGHPLVGRTLADAGVGYAYGPARLTLPLWVSRPDPGDRPWKPRWYVSLDLAGIHPWW